MKKAIITLFAVLSSFILIAQTPEAFKYQAVARDSVGNILINQNVSFQISILKGSASGTIVLTETHEVTTNDFGLANLEIGHGTHVTGTLDEVNWVSGNYFLQVEFDVTGETNYQLMGTTQLLSVPYSLNAKRTESILVVDTIAQIDTITNPELGMTILCKNSHYSSNYTALYIWDGEAWQYSRTYCYPNPTVANAGEDQSFSDNTISTLLQGNEPVHGTGSWEVLQGIGGSFDNINDPNTNFTGIACETYTLQWKISTGCYSLSDEVILEFFNAPTVDAGEDQWYLNGTSTTLNGNVPLDGTGLWTIESGIGGNITSPALPNSLFTGQVEEIYELKWTITGECANPSDNVFIHFGEFICGLTPTVDDRDGQTYATAQIGSQCWMAENLNVGIMIIGNSAQTNNDTIEKYCFYNDTSYCDTYGGLYRWDEMMQYTTTPMVQGICPLGWHIPTDEEWKQLEGEVDSYFGYPDPEWDNNLYRGFDVGLKLKTTSGWNSGGNGDDAFGFTALPSGCWELDEFHSINYTAYFWTSSEFNSNIAWMRELRSDNNISGRINLGSSKANWGWSVRCVMD